MELKKNQALVPFLEAKRINSSDQTVIFLDRTPKSLYEYHLNKYTPDDIMKIAENTRMEFDAWDKMYNLYRSSNSLLNLSGGNISVLYQDYSENQFIYSFATKKIYYYNKDVPPYVNLNQGMTINEFLEISKRDFEALLRMPQGKKYVTESSVITEGLKEIFGYGKALRVFIDGKINKNQYVFDRHSYAFIDGLLSYSKNEINQRDFDNICRRQTHILEVYDNHKLGSRDEYRRMTADENALIERKTLSFSEIVNQVGEDPDAIYSKYVLIKKAQTLFNNAIPKLKDFIKKNKLSTSCGTHDYTGFKQNPPDKLMKIYDDNPMIVLAKAVNGSGVPICSFNEMSYHNMLLGTMRNRLERFSNKDINTKFQYLMECMVNILLASDKSSSWRAYYEFDRDKDTCEANNNGICTIYITTYRYTNNSYPSTPAKQGLLNGVGYNLKLIDTSLFEYFMYGESEDYSDQYIQSLVKESSEQPLEVFLNTLEYVKEESDGARKVINTLRNMKDTLVTKLKTADIAQNMKSLFNRTADGIQNTLDEAKKEREESDREIVITDSTYSKFRRYFRQVLGWTLGAYFMYGWLAAIVTYIVTSALASDDKKARDGAIRELELELKLTREKIEDSRSDGNKQEKYALMRLESKIEDDIARIKYGAKK